MRGLEELETEREHLELLLDEADLEPATAGGKPFWNKLRAEVRQEARRRPAA